MSTPKKRAKELIECISGQIQNVHTDDELDSIEENLEELDDCLDEM